MWDHRNNLHPEIPLYPNLSGDVYKRQVLNCDILEVEPQMPYENDYNSMLKRAQEELAAILQ